MRRRPPVRTLAPAPCAFASTPYAPHVVVPAPATSNHSALSIYSAAVPSPLRAARRRPYRRAHKRPPRLASVHPHTPRTFLSTLEHSPEPSELALAGNPPEPNSIATVRPQILLIPFSIPWDVNPDSGWPGGGQPSQAVAGHPAQASAQQPQTHVI
ncbi:hypothetical protein GUJ93_ZPchr0008g13595 [Zizania palustris]|uniref:Uncharacterized protein n=1 Tax=Zizania palustris TaxID=103762 RepID=A0A8J5VG50_ZIZPA|nr:hypothetical protein GUJ93_ZPchr0008g13595 [Zizania palustris]